MFVFSGTVEEMKVSRCRLELKGAVCPVCLLFSCRTCFFFLSLAYCISYDKTEQMLTKDLIYFEGQPSETAGQTDHAKGQLLPLVVN